MIEKAESDGILKPGQPDQILIEPSSGNTGIGLAMVCQVKGYHLKVVLPTNVSIERRQLLELWGAEIIESPGSEGSNGAVRLAQDAGRRASRVGVPLPVRQPGQPAGPLRGHRAGDLAGLPRDHPLRGRPGHVGHPARGGPLPRRERNPDVQIWAVEPPAGEMVDGLRNLDDGYIPPIFEELGGAELLDRKTVVRPRESIEWTRRLTDVGIFAGISSGAAVAGAVKCASSLEPGVEASIVVVSADGGWKYLSTGAWTDDLDEVVERAKSIIYF